MARPARSRKVCVIPKYTLFGAREEKIDLVGHKAEEKEDRRVVLSLDEYEAIRLIDYLGRTHEQCAAHMGISRTTTTEIYERARFKLSDMLVNGKELVIEGGSVALCDGNKNCGEACGGGCSGSCGNTTEGGVCVVACNTPCSRK